MGRRDVLIPDYRNLRAVGINMVTDHIDGTGNHNQVVGGLVTRLV
ncbi:hypothetical protein VCR17J2_400031 [Vibrio coralliirubri]|nr:hypothetical protein VCR17J2_400031 [Vibrio coralliirubri]